MIASLLIFILMAGPTPTPDVERARVELMRAAESILFALHALREDDGETTQGPTPTITMTPTPTITKTTSPTATPSRTASPTTVQPLTATPTKTAASPPWPP